MEGKRALQRQCTPCTHASASPALELRPLLCRESWDKDALSCTTATELQDFVAERKGNLARDDAKQLRKPWDACVCVPG